MLKRRRSRLEERQTRLKRNTQKKKIFLKKKKDKKEGLIKRPLTGRWLGLKSAGRGSGEGAAPPPSPPAREEKSGWHPRLEKRQTSLKKKTSKVKKNTRLEKDTQGGKKDTPNNF